MTKQEYILNPKLCQKCKKPLSWEQRRNKYCSHSCAASVTNIGNSRNRIQTNRFCKNCGKLLDAHHKYYCCQECLIEHEQNEYIKRWKNGQETGLSGKYGLSDRIKKLFNAKV